MRGRGKTCRLLLLAVALQLSTAAAFAVTGVDACYRPDGVGDESTATASAAPAEDGESVEGTSAVIVTMPDGSGDAFDASSEFGD